MAHILIIDDQIDLLSSLVAIFELEGYEATDKSNGLAGLDEARRAPPDLVISDINLPQLSGLDIARQLRTNPQTMHIPIIMITADPNPDLDHLSMAAGANHLLRKPFNVDELLNVVRQLLSE